MSDTAQTLENSTLLRGYLRQHTALAHRELDRSMGVLDSMDRYGRYLRGQFIFRGTMEAALAGASLPGWFEDWRPQYIADAVQMDMADMGRPMPGAAGPPADALCHMANPSGLAGVLYVLEGSSLGARFTYRSAQALGLSATFGARHLALQSESGNWQGFQYLLAHPGIDREKAADAARGTFAYARAVFANGMNE